jgi:hypothetical protein
METMIKNLEKSVEKIRRQRKAYQDAGRQKLDQSVMLSTGLNNNETFHMVNHDNLNVNNPFSSAVKKNLGENKVLSNQLDQLQK